MKRLIFVILMVSLLFTATVAAQPLARRQSQQATVHVVQAGQTLFSIARLYGVEVSALANANGILNPNYIYVGQRLTIPGTAAPPADPPAQSTGGVYIVQPGDTLFGIARRYGVTAWAIATANGIYNLNHIYIGQRLVIPGAAAPPANPPAQPTTQPTTQPPSGSPPATSTAWRGEYYNGTEPTGGPLFVQNDHAINFQWGLRSPDTRLNIDYFSAHWTRTINYRGGLYRFTVSADDGVRLWVDGELVIDEWRIQVETTYEAEVVLTPGNHLIAIDYFDETGVATMIFSFKRLGDAPPADPTATPTAEGPTPTPGAGDGDVGETAYAWLGQYYGNMTLEGSPVITRVDAQIAFDWGTDAPMTGIPEEFFSVRWTRQAEFHEDNYLFCARADDGVRLYFDDDLIIDEWHGGTGYPNYCEEIDVTEGTHTIIVEYYEDGRDALISVWWERH